MKGGLIMQYLDRVIVHYANTQTIAKLQRAQDYVGNQPVMDYSDGALWNGVAKYDAVAIIDAARRACKYNSRFEFIGHLAHYRRTA